VAAGTPVHLTLAGHGIPNDGTVDAVTATIEVVSPTTAGYIRVTPDLSDSQTAVQEFRAGQTISNLFTVELVNGRVQIRISAGSARVQVDINGYFSVSSVSTGDVFHPVSTARVLAAGTTVTATSDVHLTVAGEAGVPGSGATAIAGVVEVSGPTAAGYVRVNPDGVVSQTANQEFVAGQTISDAVAVGLSDAGGIQVHISAGRALLLVDIAGWFGSSICPGLVGAC
jgi:VCBS repeat-containing protein